MKISALFSPQNESVLKLEHDVEAFGFVAAANGQSHYSETIVGVLGGTRLKFMD